MAGGGLVVEVAMRRRRFTEAEKAEVWERRHSGEPTRGRREPGTEASTAFGDISQGTGGQARYSRY